MEIRAVLPENIRVLPLVEELRTIKTPAEIDMIRRAARCADTAVRYLVSAACFGSSIAEGIAF